LYLGSLYGLNKMTIDTHTHIWNSLHFSKQLKRYTPSYIFSQEKLEETMNKHKIKKAVLVQPSFLENDNSLILKTIALKPHKYRGVIVLDDFNHYKDLDCLLYTYNQQGVRGIRFNLLGKELPSFNTKKYKKLFSLLIKLNWHLEIHANEKDICTLFKDFKNYKLTIVLDHFARPKKEYYSQEFVSLLHSPLIFYIKLSANYRFNNYGIKHYLNTLLQSIGKEKLLWGSDCPFTRFENVWSYQKSLDLLMKNAPISDLKESLDNNAHELYFRS